MPFSVLGFLVVEFYSRFFTPHGLMAGPRGVFFMGGILPVQTKIKGQPNDFLDELRSDGSSGKVETGEKTFKSEKIGLGSTAFTYFGVRFKFAEVLAF